MYPQEKELQDKATALLHPTGDDLRREMKDRGLDVRPFEAGSHLFAIRTNLQDGSTRPIEIKVDYAGSSFSSQPTGDVIIKIQGVWEYEKDQNFRRRKDGTFNWGKIAEKIKAVKKALAESEASRKREAEIRDIKKANKDAAANLADSGYYQCIRPTGKADDYHFQVTLRGLSLAQITGLAAHIEDWAKANNVQWPL